MSAAIQRGLVDGCQWGARLQALHQVGTGNEQPAERNEVELAGPACALGACQVVAIVADVQPVEKATQALQVKALLDIARTARNAFDHMQVQELERTELLHHVTE
jgi:hypothetical protein